MKKRILISFIIICLGVFLFGILNASADTHGDFTYTVSNGTVCITGYRGTATDVKIPEKNGGYPVIEIGECAFYGCNSLTSITIPDGVTEIGFDAFYGCSSLTSITIPNGVTEIGYGAFEGCSSLTSITIPDSVTEIGHDAFYGCSSLTSITISDGVTEIGRYTFSGCNSLTSITIPDGVTEIGYDAFYGCSSLTSITIPDGVTEIGYDAFYGCSSLTSITIPDSVTEIGHDAFSGCNNLKTAGPIGSGCNYEFGWKESIPSYAFYGCSSLTSITIPDGVTEIGYDAFYGCSSLTSITIPDGVTEIWDGAFYGCSSLTSIMIPDGVTEIGGHAFSGCSSLTSITIPDGVTEIGSYAFYECNNLKTAGPIGSNCNIEFGWKESIPYKAFYGYDWLISVKLPNGLTEIAYSAFSGCSSLTSITIPESVTKIGSEAFRACRSLTSITIPESVTKIGSDAFRACSSLRSMYFKGDSPTIGEGAFYAVTAKAFFPVGNYTWTKDVLENGFGGNIDWHAWDPVTETIFEPAEDSQISDNVFRFDYDILDYKTSECFTYIVLDDIKTLPGVMTDTENFDSVVWEVSDPQILEIKNAMLSEDVLFSWGITIKALKPGTAVLTGTTSDGRVVYCEITVEPKIEIKIPEVVSAPSEIIYTVTLNEADHDYLKSYISNLKCWFEYKDTGSAIDGWAGNTCSLEKGHSSYIISDDGTSAVYTLRINPKGQGSHVAYVFFGSDSGWSCSESTTIMLSDSDFNFLYEDGSKSKFDNLRLKWSDNGYDQKKIEAELEITFIPQDESSEIVIDKVCFELTGALKDYFKIEGDSVIYENNRVLDPGETYTQKVTLVKRGLFWGHPGDGEEEIGSLVARIEGSNNVSIDTEFELKVYFRGKEKEEETKEESKVIKQLEKDSYNSAVAAIKEYENISGKIAFNAQLEKEIGKTQTEALELLVYSAISLANISQEPWKEAGLSDQVIENVMDEFLGDWNPQFALKDQNIPISVIVKNDDGKRIQCDINCDLQIYALDQSPFGLFGSIDIVLTYLDELKPALPLGGSFIAEADLEKFSNSVWEIAKSELKQGYELVWGDDVDEVANGIMEDSIHTIAASASEYGLSRTVEEILKVYYEEELENSVADGIFELLVYPSKMVVARCPVDLFIYDSADMLVGSIEDDEVTLTNDNIALWTKGDSKYVRLFKDDYRIEYRSTDTGTMTLEVYDHSSGISGLRVCTFEHIPLEIGLNYKGNVDADILTDSEHYSLESNKNTTLSTTSVKYLDTDNREGDISITAELLSIESGCISLDLSDNPACVIIVPVYDENDRMIACGTARVQKDHGYVTVEMDEFDVEETSSLKIFYINSLEDAKPVGQASMLEVAG